MHTYIHVSYRKESLLHTSFCFKTHLNVIAERLSARLMIVHSALAMGIYIYMSVTLLRACAGMSAFQLCVYSTYGNEFLRVRIMIFLGWLAFGVIMESETGQRARRHALGRERVQQARIRQTEEQRQRTRQLDRSRRRLTRQSYE